MIILALGMYVFQDFPFRTKLKLASPAVCVCVLSCDIGAAPEFELPRTLLWLLTEKKRLAARGSFTAAQSKFGSQLSELEALQCRLL